MASKYGGAQYRPLSKTQTQPLMRAHDIVCAHTMVGYLSSTDVMFHANGFGGTESHYGVGGAWGSDVRAKLDGAVYQWQDRAHTADANLYGNSRVISIETADNAPPLAKNIKPWTEAQLAALVDLIAWECSVAAHAGCPSSWSCHKGSVWSGVEVAIPPVLIPDTRPSRRGLATHRQGVTPAGGVGTLKGYRVSGGEEWSTSRGKECPGDARAKQFEEVVIPRVQAKIKAGSPNTQKEDDVTEKELTAAIVKVLTTEKIVPNRPTEAQLKADPKAETSYYTVVGALANVERDQDGDRDTSAAAVQEIKTMLAALIAFQGIPVPPA